MQFLSPIQTASQFSGLYRYLYLLDGSRRTIDDNTLWPPGRRIDDHMLPMPNDVIRWTAFPGNNNFPAEVGGPIMEKVRHKVHYVPLLAPTANGLSNGFSAPSQ